MSILTAQIEELDVDILVKEEALELRKVEYNEATKADRNEISVLKRLRKSIAHAESLINGVEEDAEPSVLDEQSTTSI